MANQILTQPPQCGIHGAFMFWDIGKTAWICQQCAAAPAPQAEPQYTNRHGERCSQACGEGRHSECTETLATCNCTCRGGHKTMHRYMNTGAAPAETAGPTWCKKCRGNWRADMLGRCLGCGAELVQRANSLDSTENAGNGAESDTSGPTRETAGEMTAEQFWQSKEWRKLELATPTQTEDQYWLRFAEAFAKQRVEQAERQWQSWGVVEVAVRNPSVAEYCKHWEGRVADLERERDRWKAYGAEESRKCLMVDKIIDQQESELREMREALADFVQQLKRALQRNKEAELVELIANGNRLLARKAGS